MRGCHVSSRLSGVHPLLPPLTQLTRTDVTLSAASGSNMSRMNWREARTWLAALLKKKTRDKMFSPSITTFRVSHPSPTPDGRTADSDQLLFFFHSLNHFSDQKKKKDADCFLWGRKKNTGSWGRYFFNSLSWNISLGGCQATTPLNSPLHINQTLLIGARNGPIDFITI